MLDSDTKNRISTLKDILVGKVPNPLSQAEQITTGLIYKFMDDMDQESIEMGGEGSFFVGDYEKYAWRNLFDPKLSGVDRVKFYSEAIEKMYLNPTAPQLFRDIFKNAFLPFKDPKTLKMFLKEIDEFHYSHSEKLGDAFEHLLMLMGVQGDTGMFRTPRHIIDFIVEIVNPQKHESILDPACGTAGFLISSYKHLLKTNSDKKEGDLLSAEDKKRIGNNLIGSDISPEMVRLSLVNMYLHGFKTPNIEEYDTLSSEDKWNEYYDVILANPPFFSPKGGIQPHNQFGVQSKRAEVLFTSYILDHLKPEGRAGIIIPDGIIFKTENAYKELRKQLVETSLIGVISLPAGVFEPYSDSKTSILILDKKLLKEKESIFFAEVKNDGFSLNKQRNPIEENDLPNIIECLFSGNESKNINYVKRSDLLANSTISLRNRIKPTMNYGLGSNHVELGEVCSLMTGGTPRSTNKEFYDGGDIIWLVSGDIHKEEIYECEGRITKKGLDSSNTKFLPINSVLIALNGKGVTRGKVAMLRVKATCNQSLVSIMPNNEEELLPEYLYICLKGIYQNIRDLTGDKARSGLNMSIIRKIKIPLVPLNIQKEIVQKVQEDRKVIEENKKNIEIYTQKIQDRINKVWGEN